MYLDVHMAASSETYLVDVQGSSKGYKTISRGIKGYGGKNQGVSRGIKASREEEGIKVSSGIKGYQGVLRYRGVSREEQ